MHGGPDSRNVLGAVLFISVIPASILHDFIQDHLYMFISEQINEVVFWFTYLTPWLVLIYYLWRRFFKWLEPEDIEHKPKAGERP